MRTPQTGLRNRTDSWDATLTPMIDVVFNLLIFFVWTSSFQGAEGVLPSQLLPRSATGVNLPVELEQSDFDAIVVMVHWSNESPSYVVNGAIHDDLRQVQNVLATIAKIKSDLPVILEPDDLVPLHVVIDAYDAARQAGFTTIDLAVQK